MPVTIVGDFADPLSYLASQRVEQLRSLGLLDVRWVAVQEDRLAPIGGRPLGDAAVRELDRLCLPGEHVPTADVMVPNSRAATAAYAESLTDGRADAVRRALFDAIWVAGKHVDDPNVVRRLVFDVDQPDLSVDIEAAIAANRMIVPLPDPDPLVGTRRLGLVVSMAGGPLTVAGQDRVDGWRRLWQHRGAARLPLLLTDLGEARSGEDALAWLADRLPHDRSETPTPVAVADPTTTTPELASV